MPGATRSNSIAEDRGGSSTQEGTAEALLMKIVETMVKIFENRGSLKKQCDELETQVIELTIKLRSLESENRELKEKNPEELRTRIVSLEAALDRIMRLFSTEWVGPEAMALMRACRAVLEDESWKK
jgi:uncharacterized coiled-coil DUF342 family protein